MLSKGILALCLCLLSAAPASADVFIRVFAPGYTVGGNQQTVSFKVATPTVALTIGAKNDGMSPADLTTATLQYFLDEQPVSPPLATPFAWTWTPPAGFKGVHTLQAKVVAGGVAGTVYKAFASMVFGAPDTGPQRLPALAPFTLAGTSLNTVSEYDKILWYNFTGPPVLPNLPIPDVQVPYPPVDPQAALTGGGWIIEPLTNAGHNYAQGVPRLCYEANGQPWVCKWYQQAGNVSPVAAGFVSADLHVDGPRGVNTVSPYATCIAPPAGERGWTCIDLAGRLYSISPVGHVTTIVGPWQACDNCPVQWRGNFEGGLRFNVPNDLSYDIIDPLILYVADTYNDRIAKVDLAVSPPKITTLAGSTRGYLDGPGLTAKFNRPYSLQNHGPHTCPGRPEFIDCIHIYVADTMNGAIRILDLHRHGEIPNVITQLGGPSKLPAVDAAYADPTPFVQNCTKPDCAINWPMVIRWDSEFNTIIGETVTGAIRRWNWKATTCNGVAATGCLELITVRPGGKRTAMKGTEPGWLWLAVDRRGELGPLNGIYWGTSITSSGDLFYVSPDGVTITKIDGSGGLKEGQGRYISDFPGHYFWGAGISNGKLGLSGFGSVGFRQARPFTPADHKTSLNATLYQKGRNVIAAHPEIAVVYGQQGWNRLGLKTWDELANLGDADLFAQLRQWVPGLSDADAAAWAYLLRWHSLRATAEPILAGVAMGPAAPPPPPPPTMYTVTLTKSGTGDGTLIGAGSFPSGTTPTVSGTPNTASQFEAWKLCSTSTAPSITLPPLAANVTCEAVFTLKPPPPATIDRFDLVPLAVTAGQSAVLTWATSNALSVTLNGVAVAASGTLTVAPAETTNYDLLVDGMSRRLTLTVTAPVPDIEIRIKKGLNYKIIEVTP